MKAIMSIITISAAASLLNAPVSRAQETAPEPAGLHQAQEAMQVAQDELARAQAEAQTAQAQAQKAQADAKADYAEGQQQQQQMERVQKEMAQASVPVGAEHSSGTPFPPKPEYTDRLQNIVHAPNHGAGKALVNRSSESDLKEQTQLEEDLAVMSHILEKAASERVGGHGPDVWRHGDGDRCILYSRRQPPAQPLSRWVRGFVHAKCRFSASAAATR